MKHYIFTLIIILICYPISAFSGTIYDFDWDDKNDMRGAWMMCATTGFAGGDCPKVLTQCWKPPMIYLVKRKKKWRVYSYCVDAPNFFVDGDDLEHAAEAAKKKLMSRK